MSGSRQPQPRDNPSAELQELRSQRSLLEAIALDQRKIRKLLAKLQVYSMALPELIETAVATEIEEGLKLQSANTELKAALEALQALHDATPTPGVGEAIVNLQEIADRIATINPTPVSDAIVTEAIANTEIPTPDAVEAAPEVAPEVIQEPAVVEAALEAIVDFDAE
jgi:hypothetical protein